MCRAPKKCLLMMLSTFGLVLASGRELKQGLDGRALKTTAVVDPSFFPAECERLCRRTEDYHVPLPTSANASIGNAATQWGVALLIQVQAAVMQGKTSPPLVARTLAVFSTAVYDAVAVLSRSMRPVHATANARQPGAMPSRAGMEAAIAGAAYTAIQALLPTGPLALLDDLLVSTRVNNESAAFLSGVTAANQVLAARSQDGFAAPVPPNTNFPTPPDPFPNPAMSTTVTTTCAVTKIDTWQQLKVPAVKAFTPAPGAVFPPENYDAVKNITQGFLAYRAAFAKPFSAATADDLVSSLRGPNMLPDEGARFYAEMREVLSLSATLDDVNKTIAEVWADGPDSTFPPGHWYRIALEEAELRGLTLSKTVVMLLAVGNALQDAGIAAWSAKAKWYSSRPITGLQCIYQGQQVTAWRGPYLGVGLRDGSTWQPYQPITFVTPPFPGYISGHSTFSAAAARVLTRFFNNDKFKGAKCYRADAGSSLVEPMKAEGTNGWVPGFTDTPSENGGPGFAPGRPVVLCWDTFQDAANQSGYSRLLGGIHVGKDNIDGLALGDVIGSQVVDVVNAYAPGNL